MPFTEVAHDIWVGRYEWFDVNVTLIRGSAGLLVVDTHASALAAREVIEDVRALGAGEVFAVVNTHEHFDHTFGNGVFLAEYGAVPVHAHEVAAESTVAAGERIKERYDEPDNVADPHREEVQATEIVPADTTFSSAVALDLGDRTDRARAPGTRPHRRRPGGPGARCRRAAHR